MPLIEIGRRAPGFSLQDQDNKNRTLKDFSGRVLVLFFYPEDATDKCTEEVCRFRDRIQDFRKIKAAVIGVSPDSVESHRRFAAEHMLDYPLLADPEHTALGVYGVWIDKTVFGNQTRGVVRTTYLIDAKGRVARRWDRVNVHGHVDEVLAAVRALHAGEPLLTPDREVKPLKPRRTKKQTHTKDTDPPYTPVRGPTAASRSTLSTGGSRAKRTSRGKPRTTQPRGAKPPRARR